MSISSVGPVTGVPNSFAAAAQEATETSATTKQEAAHGDQQAIRKLANQGQQQQTPVATPTSQPGVGGTVDSLA
jgi:hypothetical protein